MTALSIPGYQLPAEPETGGRQAQGFVTPTVDRLPQKVPVLPRRVLPIVFLPGIMGSNLRLSSKRQSELKKDNNIAWRPDRAGEAVELLKANAARRQRQLDPNACEVDVYSADAPTGNATETPEERHGNAEVEFVVMPFDLSVTTPLLMDDPPTAKPRKTKQQKARERGWGEVYFDSYGELLQLCEQRLNSAFRTGRLGSWWKSIIDVDPAIWEACKSPKLKPLTEGEVKAALAGCWFPVHAMGYNWLKSSWDSGVEVARRIDGLIDQYGRQGFQCKKVVLVTHSMGGLVARAIIHPKIGNSQNRILGVVHGVMPAIGAAAAYKRMRCGFEDGGLNVASKVLGNYGDEVTAVLGNSAGGLELLPSQTYGNEWLQVIRDGSEPEKLPREGDPYREIYKLKNVWYRLLKEDWINPADAQGSGVEHTYDLLEQARKFHAAIGDVYHPNSFAHYGVDNKYSAWHRIIWRVGKEVGVGVQVRDLKIVFDSRQGEMRLVDPEIASRPGFPLPWISAKLQPAADPGDQTVPSYSADHQRKSGKFKGIFLQTGYEHQGSYKNESALHSTIYSLICIIRSMDWSE